MKTSWLKRKQQTNDKKTVYINLSEIEFHNIFITHGRLHTNKN